MLNAKNQFGVGQIGQSKCKIEAQVKKNLSVALMDDLMLAFLANRIRYEAQSENKAWRNSHRINNAMPWFEKRHLPKLR